MNKNMEMLVVGNLKMNILSISEREEYIKSFKKELKELGSENDGIVLCVPSVHLEAFAKKIKNIGVQNIFWEDKGSFTGELSPLAAANLGAKYSIIAHSERRRYFSETSENANLKIRSAIKSKLTPIYCVGEAKDEKDNGTAAEIITGQIMEGFSGLSAPEAEKVIVAYEPVWSVGSDAIPASNEILEVRILLKKIFANMYGLATAEKIKVLYGGSVKAETVEHVCIQPGMDGVLVGRESLVPRDFVKIIKEIEKFIS